VLFAVATQGFRQTAAVSAQEVAGLAAAFASQLVLGVRAVGAAVAALGLGHTEAGRALEGGLFLTFYSI